MNHAAEEHKDKPIRVLLIQNAGLMIGFTAILLISTFESQIRLVWSCFSDLWNHEWLHMHFVPLYLHVWYCLTLLIRSSTGLLTLLIRSGTGSQIWPIRLTPGIFLVGTISIFLASMSEAFISHLIFFSLFFFFHCLSLSTSERYTAYLIKPFNVIYFMLFGWNWYNLICKKSHGYSLKDMK